MGLTDAKVVALVMYPVTRAREWNGVYGISKYVISDEEFTKKVNELNSIFHLPIYLLGENEDLEKLCNTIIDFF